MKKSINLRSFPVEFELGQMLKIVSECGFDAVEFNFDGKFSLDAMDHTGLRKIRQMIHSSGLTVSGVYSREQWLFPINSPIAHKREKGMELVKRLIDAAHAMESDMVLVIPGVVDNSLLCSEAEVIRYDEAYASARDSISELGKTAGEKGVFLALETVWNKFLLSPLEFKRLMEETGSRHVGIYIDAANILNTGCPQHWIQIMAERVKGVHVKDFRKSVGNIHGFVNILEGDVEWDKVMSALKQINYSRFLTSEVLPPYRYYPERLVQETGKTLDSLLEFMGGDM